MNIKKLFATLAGVSLFAQTVITAPAALAADYSQELQDAYNWAYGKSVTTMSPIDNANMYGKITRAELAKMLANWAKTSEKVSNKTLDTSKSCEFTDTASVKGDLGVAIKEACQLGLMGQGITAFRPYDTITRAEFGTALSRALWGNKYDGATPFYVNHLNALNALGVMKVISNAESMQEVRGYVMLMLMRVENTDIADQGDNNETPSDEVVKSGDLAVSATAAAGRKAIINAASDLDTLKFKTSEKVDINKIVLERYGYSKRADVVNVWLEDENGNEISSKGTVNTRDQVSLTIKKDYRTVDGSYNATVVVLLSGTVTENGTIGFKVVDAESTAKNLNLSNYTPYEYDMVGYSAASDVTVDQKGSDKTYNYEEGEKYEVAKLKVKAGSTAISVNGFTFANDVVSKPLDLKNFLDKVEVTVDGDAVKGVEFNVNKAGELTISFNEVEIAAKSSVVFAVSIALADFDEYGTNVNLYLKESTYFKATEKKTGARITLTAANFSSIASEYPTYKFAGSKIKLSNTKLGNIEFAQGSSDVVVSEGTITLAEPVEYVGKGTSKFVVEATYKSGSTPVTGDVIEEMRLLVSGEEYVASKTGLVHASKSGYVFTFPEMEIEKSGKFQVVVDLNTDNEAPAGTVVEFSGSFDDAVFSGARYTDSNRSAVESDEISGVISFATKLTVQAGRASFVNNLGNKTIEFINNEVNTKTVFDGTYTAKKSDVNLTDFVIASAANIPDGVTSTFYMYIDGKEVGDVRLRGTTYTGSDSISKVSIKAGETVKVRVDAEVNAKNAFAPGLTGDLGTFSVVINGEDDNNNPITTTAKNTNKLAIVTSETIKITETSATSTNDVLVRGTESKLAQFTVKPSNSNSSANFSSFVFVGTYTSGGTQNYGADDLVVTLGNDELECTGVGTITCDVNEDIASAGATVTIKLSDATKAKGVVEINVIEINETGLSTPKTFSKTFLDIVVRVVKQEIKKATTVFTLSVDIAEDYDYEPKDFTVIGYNNGYPIEYGVIADGATITLPNATDADLVYEIQYKDDLYGTYGIDKDNFKDYFKNIPTTYLDGKTGTEDLMVANAG